MPSFTKISVVLAAVAALAGAVFAFLKRERLASVAQSLLGRDEAEPPSVDGDEVDEALAESFPASDPPSYGPGV